MDWNRGTIGSALLHGGFIVWVILGDWLFAPADAPEIPVAEVSLVSSAEFDKMSAQAAAAAQAAVTPPAAASEPPPQRPAPAAEATPEVLPEAEIAQPDLAPVPDAPLADVAQPIPVPSTDIPPAPRPIDRVADTPVNDVNDTPVLADTVTPEVTDQPAENVVETPPEPAASPQEAATQIVTEAVETSADAPQLAPTASRRPQGRPKPTVAEPPPDEVAAQTPPDPAAEPTDTTAVDDAVAAALAEASADPAEQPSADTGASSGPPMSAGEQDALRVAIKKCWNLGALSSEAMRTTVTIYVALGQDGTPDLGSLALIGSEGGSAESANKMFEVARRAIARCGKSGFPLPPEKYETWKELELVFDPDGMRLR